MARQHAVKSQANFDGLFGRMEAESALQLGMLRKLRFKYITLLSDRF